MIAIIELTDRLFNLNRQSITPLLIIIYLFISLFAFLFIRSFLLSVSFIHLYHHFYLIHILYSHIIHFPQDKGPVTGALGPLVSLLGVVAEKQQCEIKVSTE